MTFAKVNLTTLQPMATLDVLPAALRDVPRHQRLDACWLGAGFEGVGYFDRQEIRAPLAPLQRHGQPEVTVDAGAGTVTYAYPAEPMPEAERQAVLNQALADLAEARWRYEVGGIAYTRAGDGATYGIATDRESQGKLDAERNAALAGLRAAGDVWKCLDVASGLVVWVPFSDAEIVEIAAAARAHVAAAFKREGQLAALIAAGDPTITWSPPEA